MTKNSKIACLIMLILVGVGTAVYYLRHATFAILDPKGPIAQQERSLMITVTLLMLVVVIPVFFLTFVIAWKYRASNIKATYTPEVDGNPLIETIWWLIPSLLIISISIITWRSSHQLNPSRALVSYKPPLTIQVVALQWKWLFIYPAQHIASLNFVQIPRNTAVTFLVTSDAPMNSFWIPQLGGQTYAMSGMSMPLNLMASQNGNFRGSSANISGVGFSDMNFRVRATSQQDFKDWVDYSSKSNNHLNTAVYDQLSRPGIVSQPKIFSLDTPSLYNSIVNKYAPFPMDSSSVSGMSSIEMNRGYAP